MKSMVIRNGILVIVAVFALTVALPLAASAQTTPTEDVQTTAEEKREAAKAAAAARKEAAQTRLADAKLKACENRERVITNIMARIADRGQKHIDLFTKIADRTKTFYAEKGRTLANYDALVAEVDAKKADAQAAVDTTKSTSTEFACDGTDPKGAASSFKTSLKTQNEALKAYKTSVKDLIVGVKSAQSTANSETTEESTETEESTNTEESTTEGSEE